MGESGVVEELSKIELEEDGSAPKGESDWDQFLNKKKLTLDQFCMEVCRTGAARVPMKALLADAQHVQSLLVSLTQHYHSGLLDEKARSAMLCGLVKELQEEVKQCKEAHAEERLDFNNVKLMFQRVVANMVPASSRIPPPRSEYPDPLEGLGISPPSPHAFLNTLASLKTPPSGSKNALEARFNVVAEAKQLAGEPDNDAE